LDDMGVSKLKVFIKVNYSFKARVGSFGEGNLAFKSSHISSKRHEHAQPE